MASQKMKEATDALKMLGIGTAGAALSSWVVNMTPVVKTSSPVTKSLAQLSLGMAAVLFAPRKYNAVRYAAMGMAWAGALGAVERMTKIKALAGPAVGTLSENEIRALQSMGALPLNGPVTLRRPMNGPATMVPQNGKPSMMGGFKAPT